MPIRQLLIPIFLMACFMAKNAAAIPAPVFEVTVKEEQVTLNWDSIPSAQGYQLHYAPFPYTGPSTIAVLELGLSHSYSVQLWPGAAYYVALKSYDQSQSSDYSNIELIQIADVNITLPDDIVMKTIPGGSFTMGNNQLKGPQAGEATEHQVTLSDFEMSETEITHRQYLDFLNAAFEMGFIEVKTGTEGGDRGKQLIVGTEKSSYLGKVLYDLSGSRVMKDHDNADADNDPFTGEIEPENPLNIAFIGFDAEQQQFFIKDPLNPEDFDWHALTDYYNYSAQTHQFDQTQLLNDFEHWPELSGWSQESPQNAEHLPTKNQVEEYPVTFIRWWGAQAFCEFYGLRLPTEAEWEYAAKGGQDFFYAVYDGETLTDANWNQDELNPALHRVRTAKSGQANPYGLYNLGGNVWEWVADHYQAYPSEQQTDPLVQVEGSTTRAWRGGSWNYHQATLESSGRFYDDENKGNDHFGFRVAR